MSEPETTPPEGAPPKVEVVSVEVVEDTPEVIELDIDVRISKVETALEAEERRLADIAGEVERQRAFDEKEERTLEEVVRDVLGLQNASLKLFVVLALLGAVGIYIAARALGF